MVAVIALGALILLFVVRWLFAQIDRPDSYQEREP